MRILTKNGLSTDSDSLKHITSTSHTRVKEDGQFATFLGRFDFGVAAYLTQGIQRGDSSVNLSSAFPKEQKPRISVVVPSLLT